MHRFKIQISIVIFFIIKSIVIIVVFLVLVYKTLNDWRYVIITFKDNAHNGMRNLVKQITILAFHTYCSMLL